MPNAVTAPSRGPHSLRQSHVLCHVYNYPTPYTSRPTSGGGTSLGRHHLTYAFRKSLFLRINMLLSTQKNRKP